MLTQHGQQYSHPRVLSQLFLCLCGWVGGEGGGGGGGQVKLVDTDDYKATDRYPATAAEFETQVCPPPKG